MAGSTSCGERPTTANPCRTSSALARPEKCARQVFRASRWDGGPRALGVRTWRRRRTRGLCGGRRGVELWCRVTMADRRGLSSGRSTKRPGQGRSRLLGSHRSPTDPPTNRSLTPPSSRSLSARSATAGGVSTGSIVPRGRPCGPAITWVAGCGAGSISLGRCRSLVEEGAKCLSRDPEVRVVSHRWSRKDEVLSRDPGTRVGRGRWCRPGLVGSGGRGGWSTRRRLVRPSGSARRSGS